jgi:hypothetical protein
MHYLQTVEKIRNLNWEELSSNDLQKLMFLSYAAAREFAEALRITADLYPEDANVQELVSGELNTNNISFGEYKQEGDHADFLNYFIQKYSLMNDDEVQACANSYLQACARLDPELRAMSIFSREEQLSGIFRKILCAKDWSAPGLDAYRHYLEAHISLDSDEGGHHDLTKKFPIDDRVEPFYQIRLQMYHSIPKLFERSR